jgi:hypothetical protein
MPRGRCAARQWQWPAGPCTPNTARSRRSNAWCCQRARHPRTVHPVSSIRSRHWAWRGPCVSKVTRRSCTRQPRRTSVRKIGVLADAAGRCRSTPRAGPATCGVAPDRRPPERRGRSSARRAFWTRDLQFLPHVHWIVTAGGLAPLATRGSPRVRATSSRPRARGALPRPVSSRAHAGHPPGRKRPDELAVC